ncbi:MAG: N-6 DNA methylase, partial [Bacteroidales bacterium]|nr:N-6 DNA methylase [Bacteroidales bacterium]
MNSSQLQNIFQNAYNCKDWQEVLQSVFGSRQLFETPRPILLPSNELATQAFELGSLTTSDDRIIGFYQIDLTDNVWLQRNKVGLRELLRNIYTYDVDGAIVVFVQKEKWRLSFVSEIKVRNAEGEIVEQITEPKRYTYLLGKGEKVRTPAERFAGMQNKTITLEDIRQLFSVSTLTKEFYNELFQWYQWALSNEIDITFPRNTSTADDNRENLEEQIIRLITRLLFVWFIKQKQLVPDYLFDSKFLKDKLSNFNPQDNKNGNYYNAILQNLFFATLNKPINERTFAKEKNARDIKTLYRYAEMFSIDEQEIIDLFKPIPFLNGGLFECLDKEISTDGVKYHLDGFSRNDHQQANGRYSHRAFIPNCVFFDKEKGIIPLLERYNFTVEENAPEDVQVALDPELLGNVFENLLGAFNTETKESARKQSGSFYTPREIVDFMVNESLQTYLNQHLGNIDLSGNVSDTDKKSIYDTLLNIKILDPACGSGAFPMGILNGIINLLEGIGVAEQLDMYKLKINLIENCIYGVDMQTIAAQISKLRFFISLIVEQGEMDKNKENYGVITLPNLETKFVAANTLIGIQKRKVQGNLFEDPEIEPTKKSILEVRHEHFYAKNAKEKRQLRDKDAILRKKLSKLLEANHEFASEDAKQVAQWNPYDQNASSPFFDAEWMFGVKEGFDIVIGNPPYVQLQKNGGKLAKQFENQNFKTFARTGDIYSLFYEKGIELLKPKGKLCYITSNKWMRAGYGENTRKFFAENTNPILLIDFAGKKIFESATVDTNILLLSKEKNQLNTRACVVKSDVLNNLSDYIRQNSTKCNFNSSESWIVLSEIEQRIKAKIEAVGTPLKEWDINIYRGILTGYNEAFIIDGKKKQEILDNCETPVERKKTDELIRPLLRGRDIKRYSYEFADKYLLFIPWHFPLHNNPNIKGASLEAEEAFSSQYPAVYNHLLQYKERLSNRNKSETGIRYEWYALQRWGANYWEDFSKQKIIYPNMTKFLPFVLDKNKMFPNPKCYVVTGKHIEF